MSSSTSRTRTFFISDIRFFSFVEVLNFTFDEDAIRDVSLEIDLGSI